MKFWAKFKHLFDPRDLTSGSISKGILVFAFPIILSLFFQQIYTLTDAAIVGQTLQEAEIAGVNNTGSLVFAVLQFGFGCTSGFSVIIAEAIGAKNKEKARSSFYLQLLLATIISILLTVLGIVFLPNLLGLLGIHPSSDPYMQQVYESAYTYLAIIYGGILCQIIYNLIVATLRSLGDSFFPFLFLMGSTILNAALDALFIMVFHMGVAGSAIATIASQGLAAILAYIYAVKRYEVLRFKKDETKFTWKGVGALLKNGLPLGFQYSILSIGMIVMQASIIAFDITLGGEMNPAMPAQLGYAAACKIINLLMVPLHGLGMAFLSFTAQNFGAKDHIRIKQGLKACTIMAAISSAIACLIGLLLTIGGAYQYIFLASDKITDQSIAYGNLYLYVSSPSLIFLGLLFLFRCALQGLEKPLWPFLAGIAELIVRILICSFLPAIIAEGPIHADVGTLPFLGAVLGDPLAWISGPLIMGIPLILTLKNLGKDETEENPDA